MVVPEAQQVDPQLKFTDRVTASLHQSTWVDPQQDPLTPGIRTTEAAETTEPGPLRYRYSTGPVS